MKNFSFDRLIGIDSEDRVDPRTDASADSSLPTTHHGGEAAAAGVGAAGVSAGAYEVGKHSDESTRGTGIEGSNTAQETSGPHNTNLENKLDPRVDSDGQSGLGSSTQGGGGSSDDPVSSTSGASTTGGGIGSSAAGVGSSGVAADDKDPTSSTRQPRANDATTAQTARTLDHGQTSNNSATPGTGSTQVDNSNPDHSTKMSDTPDTTTQQQSSTNGKSIVHTSMVSALLCPSPIPNLHEIKAPGAD